MVVNFTVDDDNRIWLLWSSSIRLFEPTRRGGSSSEAVVRSSGWKGTYESAGGGGDSAPPMNIDAVVRLPPNVRLSQTALHAPEATPQNEVRLASCPSCGGAEQDERFHPVPYKTIISHFEHVIELVRSSSSDVVGPMGDGGVQWPPDGETIKATGGVGFGTLPKRISAAKSLSTSASTDPAEVDEERFVIPPVIRHIHPRLKVRGYLRYRVDPLFLHKKCEVCEACFLSYAELASTSFQMTQPVRLNGSGGGGSGSAQKNAANRKADENTRWEPVDADNDEDASLWRNPRKKLSGATAAAGATGKGRSIGMTFESAPSLPAVISEPMERMQLVSLT